MVLPASLLERSLFVLHGYFVNDTPVVGYLQCKVVYE